MKIGYIVHNLNDAAVERRARMFELGGAEVLLAGFCRDADLHGSIAARNPHLMGVSHDAAFVQRATASLRAAVLDKDVRRHLAAADVIVARNLEQLAVARALVGKRPLVYECLDIHRLLVGYSLPARLVQQVEAALLPRCDMLLTSSPAFVRNHFVQRPFKGEILLVENKLLIDDLPRLPLPCSAPASKAPLTIGWFGMLRCRKSLDFLTNLVTNSRGKIEVLIAGKPSPAELPDLAERVAAIPGMRYTGSYRYEDLADLYGQCHFAWAIDWFEEGLNSSWLLPNRLYEAIAFGAVPIALTNIELGRWLQAHGVGMLVSRASDVPTRLMAMRPAKLAELLGAVRDLDRNLVLADRTDGLAIVEKLAAIPPRRSRF